MVAIFDTIGGNPPLLFASNAIKQEVPALIPIESEWHKWRGTYVNAANSTPLRQSVTHEEKKKQDAESGRVGVNVQGKPIFFLSVFSDW